MNELDKLLTLLGTGWIETAGGYSIYLGYGGFYSHGMNLG